MLRARGARQHPGSGSGAIEFDGSTDEEVIEVKQAAKSYSFSLPYVMRLFNNAARQGKQARLVIKFPGFEIDCYIRRVK